MSLKTPFPTLPAPPAEYDQRQQQDLIRSLEQMMRLLRNPGAARHTELTLTTPGSGITLYSPNGTLYVLTVDDAGNLVIT